jgi:hypothetical protein
MAGENRYTGKMIKPFLLECIVSLEEVRSDYVRLSHGLIYVLGFKGETFCPNMSLAL